MVDGLHLAEMDPSLDNGDACVANDLALLAFFGLWVLI
jgi:hypothetical protein